MISYTNAHSCTGRSTIKSCSCGHLCTDPDLIDEDWDVDVEGEGTNGLLLDDWIDKLSSIAEETALPHDTDTIMSCVSDGTIGLQHSESLRIHDSQCSWHQSYPGISFLISGHLYAEYKRLSGLLGLPACSSTPWGKIVNRLEVTNLAEWSCGQVQQEIIERGDAKKRTASFNEFYLTRGHYSNNSSATLHYFLTRNIAYFCHGPKRDLVTTGVELLVEQRQTCWLSSWAK